MRIFLVASILLDILGGQYRSVLLHAAHADPVFYLPIGVVHPYELNDLPFQLAVKKSMAGSNNWPHVGQRLCSIAILLGLAMNRAITNVHLSPF